MSTETRNAPSETAPPKSKPQFVPGPTDDTLLSSASSSRASKLDRPQTPQSGSMRMGPQALPPRHSFVLSLLVLALIIIPPAMFYTGWYVGKLSNETMVVDINQAFKERTQAMEKAKEAVAKEEAKKNDLSKELKSKEGTTFKLSDLLRQEQSSAEPVKIGEAWSSDRDEKVTKVVVDHAMEWRDLAIQQGYTLVKDFMEEAWPKKAVPESEVRAEKEVEVKVFAYNGRDPVKMMEAEGFQPAKAMDLANVVKKRSELIPKDGRLLAIGDQGSITAPHCTFLPDGRVLNVPSEKVDYHSEVWRDGERVTIRPVKYGQYFTGLHFLGVKRAPKTDKTD